MRQMPAGIKRQSHNQVIGLQQSHINRGIGLRTGVRLHVGKCRIKQLFGTLNRQIFHHIDKLAAAIIASMRITFRIFIGHNRPLRFQHRRRHNIFRSNQLDLILLAAFFQSNRLKNRLIFHLQIFCKFHKLPPVSYFTVSILSIRR